MKRTLWLALLGATALVIFLVLRAPARLLDQLLGDALPISLSHAAGTIWNGEANIAAHGHDLGRASWNFDPATLMQGAMGLRWRISGPSLSLGGQANASPAATDVSIDGQIHADFINRLLSDYHIRLAGTFELDAIALTFTNAPHPPAASGTLSWTGGLTRYRLAGKTEKVTLPPMQAILSLTKDGHPQAETFTPGVPAPLIRTHLSPNNWLHIAVTRRFTTLAGQPWPTTGPADEIVVEVAEKLQPNTRASRHVGE